VVSSPVTLRRRRPGPLDPTGDLMPTDGPLVDSFGRIHTDLRISLTDRCNLRCVYCMPAEGMHFQDRSEHLRTEEIVRFARVARMLGVRTVRVTGGEPLLRPDIVDVVYRLNAVGFDELSLTTNGSRLANVATALAQAGLDRVNVSCDSLRAQRFSQIRRRGNLGVVLAAMEAAEKAGLSPLKVNVVIVVGRNDDEVEDFAAFARQTGRVVRFIEYMPLDADGSWDRDLVLPAATILARIHDRWPLEPVVVGRVDSDPATRFRFADGAGEIGVIASVSAPFCGTCNRLRLTADGAVRNCLFTNDELSVHDALRRGDDDAVETLMRRAVWGKLPGHGINDPGFLRPSRTMSMIGG